MKQSSPCPKRKWETLCCIKYSTVASAAHKKYSLVFVIPIFELTNSLAAFLFEIEYISASNIRAGVETRPPQLSNLLYFSPPTHP